MAGGEDDRSRDQLFRAERKRQLWRRRAIQVATIDDLAALLEVVAGEVVAALAAQPGDYELWRLPQVRAALRDASARLNAEGTRILETGVDRAWSAGGDLVEAPLAEAGVDLRGRLIDVDLGQLAATRAMMTHRMKEVSDDVVKRVNRELVAVIGGARAPSQAIDRVQELVVDGGRRRALTVVRTEVGAAYSQASNNRLKEAKRHVPGLQKQWRRSGKLEPRPHHVAADGQIREPDEPFLVGGFRIPYPRSSDIPVGERVNCGCESLPYMADWDMTTPGKRPFTDLERTRSPMAKAIADALEDD